MFCNWTLPSGYDVLAITGDGDDDSLAGLCGRTVGDLGVNIAVLEFVAVEVDADDEIVKVVQFDMSVRFGKAYRCYSFPFA